MLVSIAVISLLLSILLPSLGRARQLAKRLLCSSNLHSIGTSLKAYEADGRLLPLQYDRWGPEVHTYSVDHLEPWVSYVAYHQDMTSPAGDLQPLQLAVLFANGFLEDPEALYCSSQVGRGANLVFTYDYYTDRGRQPWSSFLPVKENGKPDDKIRSSYHYWLGGQSRLVNLSHEPVVFDNIQHWDSVGHTQNGRPYGVNALFGDGHVNFTNEKSLFDLDLWNGGPDAGPWDGPGNDKELFTRLLARLNP